MVDLENILSTLIHKGYDSFYSLEIFNNDYWADDPMEVAKNAMHHAQNLFQSIGSKEDRYDR